MLKIAVAAVIALSPATLVAQIKGAASNPSAGMHSGGVGEGVTKGSSSSTSNGAHANSAADQEASNRKDRQSDLHTAKGKSSKSGSKMHGDITPH